MASKSKNLENPSMTSDFFMLIINVQMENADKQEI